MAQVLEEMPQVISYVKNQNLGFTIPYTLTGEQHDYYPDFIARIDVTKSCQTSNTQNPTPILNLIIEVTGQKKKDKEAKVATAKTLWVPAINSHQGNAWEFCEVEDPWDCKGSIESLWRQA